MNTTIRGIRAVVRNLSELNTQIEAGVQKAKLRAAFEIEREAVSEVQVDSGRLKNSIMTREDGDIVEVGSDVEYAQYVEFGTSKMAAHPYLQPAVEKVRKDYPGIIIEDVKSEMK